MLTPDELEARILTVPEPQRTELRACLAEGWRIETDWQKIRARYQDLDLANAVPRVIIYLDLGVLIGRLLAYRRAMEEAGFTLVEEE